MGQKPLWSPHYYQIHPNMSKLRVQVHHNKLYVVTSYRKPGMKNSTTRIVADLGSIQDIERLPGVTDAMSWAKERTAELQEELGRTGKDAPKPELPLSALGTDGLRVDDTFESGERSDMNAGYLFLKKVYYGLKLDRACRYIRARGNGKYQFSLNSALQLCIYSRVISPGSNLSNVRNSGQFPEGFDGLEYQHVMRSLPIVEEEMEYIQGHLYKQSRKLVDRDDTLMLMDCTNYWFDIDSPSDSSDELRQYSRNNKSHNGKPCVGVSMVVGGDGIPVCLGVFPGHMNEQRTTGPMTDKVRKLLGKPFRMCADAGLSSLCNRSHLMKDRVTYISVLPIRKMDDEERRWCTDTGGWSYYEKGADGSAREVRGICIADLDREGDYEKVFVKERMVARKYVEVRKEILRPGADEAEVEVTGKKQKLTEGDKESIAKLRGLYGEGKDDEAGKLARSLIVQGTPVESDGEGDCAGCKVKTTKTTYLFDEKVTVTFSLKYKDWLMQRREETVKRAQDRIDSGRCEDKSVGSSRYITKTKIEGEKKRVNYSLNEDLIASDAELEGFYAVGTCDMSYDKMKVVEDNAKRWKVENVFRISKSLLEVHPVYVRTKANIIAVMLIMFISMVIVSILEVLVNRKREKDPISYEAILESLRGLGFTKRGKDACKGYVTRFNNTEALEAINSAFDNFRINQREYDWVEFAKIMKRSYTFDVNAEDGKGTGD